MMEFDMPIRWYIHFESDNHEISATKPDLKWEQGKAN